MAQEKVFRSEVEEFDKSFDGRYLYEDDSPDVVQQRINEINEANRQERLKLEKQIQDGIITAANYNIISGHPIITKSSVFHAGERIQGTMLTVLGPGFRNRYGQQTWQSVLCRCDCGNEVNVPYAYLCQKPGKFSCGCSRRARKDTRAALADPASSLNARNGDLSFAGLSVQHHRTMRRLTVLYRDETFKVDLGAKGGIVLKWIVLLECCAESTEVQVILKSVGTLLKRLYEDAAKPCPKCGANSPDGASDVESTAIRRP